jgi:hypothetical protein
MMNFGLELFELFFDEGSANFCSFKHGALLIVLNPINLRDKQKTVQAVVTVCLSKIKKRRMLAN